MVIAKWPKQLQHEYNTIKYNIIIRIHSHYPVHLSIVHCFQIGTSRSHTYLFDHIHISNIKGYGHNIHTINNKRNASLDNYTVNTVHTTRLLGAPLHMAILGSTSPCI